FHLLLLPPRLPPALPRQPRGRLRGCEKIAAPRPGTQPACRPPDPHFDPRNRIPEGLHRGSHRVPVSLMGPMGGTSVSHRPCLSAFQPFSVSVFQRFSFSVFQ